MKSRYLFILLSFATTVSFAQAPEPFGPLPSPRQLAWHELEFYMFVHFNMNTFTDMEWGEGGESPGLFNPAALDCRQWARIAKAAGMKGIIITAKHHDGFCLWPSAYTEHSVKNSPWKGGKGDVLRELREACDEYGLKMGVYLSPWDRNHADYGRPEYLDYFRNQLRELLTEYGEIFEVWFDGANGGTGYYGGANENREVDRKTYYDWDTNWNIVRKLQPGAVMFSDAGPDVRWMGNEHGIAGETNWSLLRRDEVWPGWPHSEQLNTGHEDGTHWVPAEVDVSIRSGWYYHASEDHKVKTLPQLLDIYYTSVGRNSSLLLNIPIDRRGLIHPADSVRLMQLAGQVEKDFETDLAAGKKAAASEVRLDDPRFAASQVNDGDPDTYWATDDFTRTASLTIDLGAPTWINRFLVQEYIPLGQRVQAFKVEAWKDGGWELIAEESTIGYKRILRFPDVETSRVRFSVTKAKAAPVISNIGLYQAPKVLSEPVITRNQQGEVSIDFTGESVVVYYTTNGADPDKNARKYEGPFFFDKKGTVKAVVTDPLTGNKSPVATAGFDISKRSWKLISPQENASGAGKIWDGNVATALELTAGARELAIDLGDSYPVKGFTYLPDQSRYASGIASAYELQVSSNGKQWKTVSTGEFSNIRNNPVLQTITFSPVRARYLRFAATDILDNAPALKIAEFDVITK